MFAADGTTPITNMVITNVTNFGTTTVDTTFEDSSVNSNVVIGNATFNGNSANDSTTSLVTGDTILNTTYYNGALQASSTLTLSGYAVWNGKTLGTIYASDGTTPVTDFVFTGSSSNNTVMTGNPVFYNSSNNTGTIIGNPVFNDSSINITFITGNPTFNNGAYNSGTITGSALFTNTSPFHIGTVTGTTTLSGTNQSITGSNYVTHLVKDASVRDTLYLTSGSTVNISGALTLRGVDANNLLTVRATTPGSVANFNISGTADMDFLRLKDVRNTGTTIDLSNKTVYNDGNNTGFTFNATAQSGTKINLSNDNTAPVGTLSGSRTVILTKGTSWSDPGISWSDPDDAIVGKTKSGTVNVNAFGEYTITYRATDSHGNSGSVTRTIIVDGAPVGTLRGVASYTITQNDPWVDLGISWAPSFGSIASQTVTGTVDTSVPGTYTLTYRATDVYGLSATVTRTVRVNALAVVVPPAVTGSGSSGSWNGNTPLALIKPITIPVAYVSPFKPLPTLPSFGDTTSKNTFSFADVISNFLFAPIPVLKGSSQMNTSLASVGLANTQDLFLARNKVIPLPLPAKAKDIPDGLLMVSSDGTTTIPLSAKYDSKHTLIELAQVTAGSPLTISMYPTGKGTVTATFNGETYTFKKLGKTSLLSVTLKAPTTVGTYTLTATGAPFPLVITTVPPQASRATIEKVKKQSVWSVLKLW